MTGVRSALLLGASGLVGSHLLDLLLDAPSYARVIAPVRRPLVREHAKLVARPVDFDRLAQSNGLFAVDDVFCCLGTTIGAAGSREVFRKVDYDYPVEAARVASASGARRFLVVSALGADPRSRVFYNRVKGEMERAVRRYPFEAIWIVRPSLLLGQRSEVRRGERVAQALMRPLTPLMVGPLRRYRPVHARQVAAAMLRLAEGPGAGGVVESDRIHGLAAEGAAG